MASASTGADPKHSRASRGSSTIGRPAVLSDVLTVDGGQWLKGGYGFLDLKI